MKKLIIILNLFLLIQLTSCSSMIFRGLSKIAIRELGQNSQSQYPTRTPTVIIQYDFSQLHEEISTQRAINQKIWGTTVANYQDKTNTPMPNINNNITQTLVSDKDEPIENYQNNTDCYIWSDITKSMIGQYVCVYGEVYNTRDVGNYGNDFQILFSKEPFDFYFEVFGGYFDLEPGDCIYFEGEIMQDSFGHPYFEIDDFIYECETWMK